MAKSTEVATTSDQTDVALAKQNEIEAELAALNAEESDASLIQIPLLKIGQPLTDEVATGDASPGEFINGLTREGLGKKIQFVVAGFQKGRFDHGIRGERKARKSYGTRVVPWNDDPFVGQPWGVHPDAEEGYAKRVNAGEIPWGKGPRISTTYDFTGHVLSDDPDTPPFPVCLSLMRMNTKQAKKWYTILTSVLRNKFWDAVFDLSTEQNKNDQGNFYTISVRQARPTTPEERQEAVTLALLLRKRASDIEVVGESEEAAPAKEPDSQGGLAV